MAKAEVSDSAAQESDADPNSGSGSEEVETPIEVSAPKKISDYERQRMKRIEENKARMKALGLKKMADSFTSSLPKQAKKTVDRKGKGKGKVDDDEEYRPSEGEEELDFSSEEDEKDDDEEYALPRSRKKMKNKTRSPKKPLSSDKPMNDLNFADDEALEQAIALSLQDSAGFIDVKNMASQSSSNYPIGRRDNAREGNSPIQEDVGKRKRKKSVRLSSDLWFY